MADWATEYIKKLQAGQVVAFRPRGNSMAGKVNSGQLCVVSPILTPPKPGDIVLCKVNGKQYLHLILAINNGRYQIGNNKGHINGWISENSIYGKLVSVQT